MNAQEKWKYQYSMFKSFRALSSEFDWNRDEMSELRREAALERRISALERENARLREAARKFSKAHSTGCPYCDDLSADPQDCYEFDEAFGIAP